MLFLGKIIAQGEWIFNSGLEVCVEEVLKELQVLLLHRCLAWLAPRSGLGVGGGQGQSGGWVKGSDTKGQGRDLRHLFSGTFLRRLPVTNEYFLSSLKSVNCSVCRPQALVRWLDFPHLTKLRLFGNNIYLAFSNGEAPFTHAQFLLLL